MYKSEVIELIHDKIRHLPEDRLGNLKITEDVIRTIVYQSEPGIKYIARKVNLDKEKLKKAMKNVWVTKGYKMWEETDLYVNGYFSKDNTALLYTACEDINEFMDYVRNNDEALRLSRAIADME